jgi:hypothetical protein
MILFLLLGWVLGGFTVAAAASSQGFRQTLKARSLHGWELRTSLLHQASSSSFFFNKENLAPVHLVYMNPLTGPLRMRSRLCRTSGIAEFLRATTTAACPGHM